VVDVKEETADERYTQEKPADAMDEAVDKCVLQEERGGEAATGAQECGCDAVPLAAAVRASHLARFTEKGVARDSAGREACTATKHEQPRAEVAAGNGWSCGEGDRSCS